SALQLTSKGGITIPSQPVRSTPCQLQSSSSRFTSRTLIRSRTAGKWFAPLRTVYVTPSTSPSPKWTLLKFGIAPPSELQSFQAPPAISPANSGRSIRPPIVSHRPLGLKLLILGQKSYPMRPEIHRDA